MSTCFAMDCPDDNMLAAFASQGLDEDEQGEIEVHLDNCPACFSVVSQLAAVFDSRESISQSEPSERSLEGQTIAGDPTASSPQLGPAQRLEKGETLGRYVILFSVGEGGMGIVYAAYDPELDRKLALKVLRTPASTSEGPLVSSARHPDRRMMREAKALARLSHPNVISIHDVGTHEGMPFIAMEFVEGGTLKQWLAAKKRTVREIVTMFKTAGRGLAAAHAKGMVHRDFKPDNVLIRGPEHAIVTDFGLARPTEAPADPSAAPVDASEGAPAKPARVDPSLTRTGAIVGTPAYMSPEQFRGERSDARSDQFSFCVALYEALFGQRPFQGGSFVELMANVTAGRIREDAAATAVPSWARRVVRRGLSDDPAERFASMDALLLALRPGRTRWMWLAGAAAGGAVIASASLVATGVGGVTYCDRVDEQLDGVWDAATRDDVETAIKATKLGFAEKTAELTLAQLDAYAESWVDGQEAVCEAERSAGSPPNLIAQRMTCLARARDALGTATSILASATGDDAMHASDIVASLVPVRHCDDLVHSLGEVAAPTEDEAEAVAEIRSVLGRAEVLLSAARTDEATALVDGALESVERLAYRPVRAEYWRTAARMDSAAGEDDVAYDKLHLALGEAVRSQHLYAFAEIAGEIGRSRHTRRGAALEVLRWAALGDAALDGVPGKHPEVRAQLASARASGLAEQGKLEAAIEASLEALTLRESLLGADHWALSEPLSKMGLIEARLGRYEESAAHIERARDLLAARYGDGHPLYAFTVQNLSVNFFRQGDYAEAARLARAAAVGLEKALGATHPSVAVATYTTGLAQMGLGDLAGARASGEASLAIETERFGALAPETTSSRGLLGQVFQLDGRYDESVQMLESAIESVVADDADSRRRTANYRSLLGNTARLRGDVDLAQKELFAAAEVQRELAPDSGELAETLTRQAVLGYDTTGDLAEARALVDEAIAMFDGKEDITFERAEAQILFLRILKADPKSSAQDRAAAVTAAQEQVAKLSSAAQRVQLAALLDAGDTAETQH